MSAAAIPATPQVSAYQFQLASHSGHTKVTYAPSQGPIVVGLPPKTPFVYHGPEGDLSFTEDQITREETAMGSLWSVVLTRSTAGSSTFALFLPAISGSASHAISTYAIKARKSGSPVVVGPEFTYEVKHLKGDASFVRLRAL